MVSLKLCIWTNFILFNSWRSSGVRRLDLFEKINTDTELAEENDESLEEDELEGRRRTRISSKKYPSMILTNRSVRTPCFISKDGTKW